MSSSGSPAETATIDRTQYATIRHQLATTNSSNHAALFYRSRCEKRAAATAFLDIGLQNDEKCLYIYDESDPGTLEKQFRSVGIDPSAKRSSGALEFVDGREFYVEDGFDPEKMVRKVEAAADIALDEGYSSLRAAGENTWSFGLDETFDAIIEFEATFDRDCSSLPAQTLCQYNLTRFSEEAIIKALRTHEHLIYRNTVCKNPYYVHPEEYLSEDDGMEGAVAVLEQAYDLSKSRQAVKAHEQRLEVINRIFRHNIRNDMNVLLNYLELFERKGWVAPEGRENLQTMRETLEQFIDTSKRARHIEQTIQDSEVASFDIVPVVEDCVADLRTGFPDATIDISTPDAVTVVADQHIDVALTELCENALIHAKSDRPTVSVDVTATEVPGSVCFTVENEGDIPAATRAAITEGSEKPLQHSSGLGLWLVKWLVEQSYGQLSLCETDDLCQVQVRLPTTVPDTFGE